MLKRGAQEVLFNLANVNHIDRAGLAIWSVHSRACTKQAGELKLLNLTNKVHD